MKKEITQKLFLILLPVMAVVLATTGNSVMVYNPATSITVYGSYFDLIPEATNCQILPPVSACFAAVNVILTIFYLVSRKDGVLKGIRWVALLSACTAALPVVLDRTIVIMPHVLLPILMCGQAALAFIMGKNPMQKKANTGRRLEKR